MIKTGDTYKITDIEDIKIFIKQTDGLRLTEEQANKLTKQIGGFNMT